MPAWDAERVDPRDPSTLPLAWRRSAAALATTLPALIAATGCEGKDGDGGFGITRVEFDNASTITLTFSEPVAELGAVDPNDFRISAAQTYRLTYSYGGVTYSYASSMYQDIGYLSAGYDYNAEPVRFSFASVARGSADNQLVLTTDSPLGPLACDWVDEMEAALDEFVEYYGEYGGDVEFEFGLFLHYAGGSVPIEGDGGDSLADIAAHWVASTLFIDETDKFGFPRLRPRLQIPCP